MISPFTFPSDVKPAPIKPPWMGFLSHSIPLGWELSLAPVDLGKLHCLKVFSNA